MNFIFYYKRYQINTIVKHHSLLFQLSSSYIDIKSNKQRIFLDNYAKTYKIKSQKDWENVKGRELTSHQIGRDILRDHHSLLNALITLYPDKSWDLLSWPKFPRFFWNRKENHYLVLEQVKEKLNIKKHSDWEKVTAKQVMLLGANNLIMNYKTLYNMLNTLIPEYNWNIHAFKIKPYNYWKSLENQRGFVDYVLSLHNYNNLPDDLYKLTLKDITNAGGYQLRKLYDGDISYILPILYPEYKLVQGKFTSIQLKTKESIESRMKIIEEKLNIKQKTDWKNITQNQFIEAGGSQIIYKYKDIQKTLTKKGIDTSKYYNRVNRKPNGYWRKHKNQKAFLTSIAKEYDIDIPYGWCNISIKQFKHEFNGENVLRVFPSYFDMISSVYYEYTFDPFEFKSRPKNIWERKEYHKLFLDRIYKLNKFKSLDDFYNFNLRSNGGFKLFEIYKTYYNILSSIYPHHNWDETLIPHNDSWNSLSFQRKVLEKRGKLLGVNSPEDWLTIPVRVSRRLIRPLLNRYSSYHKMLHAIYPEIEWNPLRRKQVPQKFWDSKENVKIFLTKLKKEYSIIKDEEWTRISRKQILNIGGSGLLFKYNNLVNALIDCYPNINWLKYDFNTRDKRSTQRYIFLQIQKIFNDKEILENYIYTNSNRESGYSIEFDIFIPDLLLAIEYNGEHHYKDIPAFGNYEMYKTRDDEKKQICKDNNIKYIEIPYWYDLSIPSLKTLLIHNNILLNTQKKE